KVIIFDFDGVIANSEPAHLATFQRVLAEEGIHITEVDYYQKYLAMDDKGAFTAALNHAGREGEQGRVPELIARKATYLHSMNSIVTYPDALDFIREMADRFPFAINSGALLVEIEQVLAQTELREHFHVIV